MSALIQYSDKNNITIHPSKPFPKRVVFVVVIFSFSHTNSHPLKKHCTYCLA